MQQAVEFLLHDIEMVVFLTVLAEQIGLPIPAVPVLLAAGPSQQMDKRTCPFSPASLSPHVCWVLWFGLN